MKYPSDILFICFSFCYMWGLALRVELANGRLTKLCFCWCAYTGVITFYLFNSIFNLFVCRPRWPL